VLEFEGNKYNPGVKNTLRLWPQDNDTEGFFVAKIMKN
jgi:16S rRNA C967 or C1407 C5-methylase (RsmB/RsmF family)